MVTVRRPQRGMQTFFIVDGAPLRPRTTQALPAEHSLALDAVVQIRAHEPPAPRTSSRAQNVSG